MGNTVVFNPNTNFKAGETVFATVRTTAESNGGVSLAAPHVFQLTTATSPSTATFTGGSDLGLPGESNDLAVGDLTRDGDLDLLTANRLGPSVSLRLNDGAGGFGGGTDLPAGNYATSGVAADLNNDGDLDLLVGNAGADNVSIRFNNGGGSFSLRPAVPVGNGPQMVVAADLDSDGDVDFMTAEAEVAAALNRG